MCMISQRVLAESERLGEMKMTSEDLERKAQKFKEEKDVVMRKHKVKAAGKKKEKDDAEEAKAKKRAEKESKRVEREAKKKSKSKHAEAKVGAVLEVRWTLTAG